MAWAVPQDAERSVHLSAIYCGLKRMDFRWCIDGFEFSNCCCRDIDDFMSRCGDEVVGC